MGVVGHLGAGGVQFQDDVFVIVDIADGGGAVYALGDAASKAVVDISSGSNRGRGEVAGIYFDIGQLTDGVVGV